MKQNCVRVLIASVAVVLAAMPLVAETETVGGITWTYAVSGDSVSVGGGTAFSTAVPSDTSGAINIPSSFGDKPVTSIGDSAFFFCTGLTRVTVPSGVTSIGEMSFSNCSGLTNVVFKGNAPSVGLDAFYEVGPGCIVQVQKGSRGWDVDIPGTWNGMHIEYLEVEEPEPEPEPVVPPQVLTVTFDVNCADVQNVVPPIAVTNGVAYGKLPEVTRTGYAFDGWTAARNARFAVVTSETIVTNDTDHTLYAQWTVNSYTVTYDANGGEGTMADQTNTYDVASSLASNLFVRTSHRFLGWATNETGGVVFSDGAEVLNLTAAADGVVVLYAVWAVDVPAVRFVADTAVAKEGGDAVVRVRGGDTDKSSSVKVYLTYNTASASDVDLAKGKVDGETPKGGLKSPLTLSWAEGEVGEKVITIPAKTDKTVENDEFFTLQLADAQGVKLGETKACTVTIRDLNGKTLKAAVSAFKPKKGDTVTTNSVTVTVAKPDGVDVAATQGGFAAGTGEYTSGSKLTLTAEARPGWAFVGWRQSDQDGDILSTKAKWQIVVTNDAEYVAVFKEIPYLLGLADPADGGKVTGSGIYAVGKKANLSATAAKGYVFAGWYTDPEFATPLVSDVDYRTAKISYVMPSEDLTLYARFVPVGEDSASVAVTIADEYETGKEIEPIVFAIDGVSLPTLKVAGLPSGLKFTAKALTVKATKNATEKKYAANTIYGTPTKSGVYVASATVTTAGKATATTNLYFVVRKEGEKILKAMAVDGGKVTGSGIYAVGKKANLSATAAKGYVFAGWYTDPEFATPLVSDVDYRTAKISYVMPSEDLTLYARFVESADDTLEIILGYDTCTFADLPAIVDVRSPSLPKITVSKLPSAIEFVAVSNTFRIARSRKGGVLNPGSYTISIRATNTTVKKAVETNLVVFASHVKEANAYFNGGIRNDDGDFYSVTVGVPIKAIDGLSPNEGVVPTFEFPVGMGLRYENGRFVGAADKVGNYNVSVTVNDGGAVRTSTFTLRVDPLPDWVVGNFDFCCMETGERYGTNYVWMTYEVVSVTSGGKVSGKGYGLNGTYRSWTGGMTNRVDDSTFEIVRNVAGINGTNYVQSIKLSQALTGGGVAKGYATVSGGNYVDSEAIIGDDKIPVESLLDGGQYLGSNEAGTFLNPTFPGNSLFTNDLSDVSNGRTIVWNNPGREFLYEGRILIQFGKNGTLASCYEGPDGKRSPVLSSRLALVDVSDGLPDSGDPSGPVVLPDDPSDQDGQADASVDSMLGERTRKWRFAALYSPENRTRFIAVTEITAKGGAGTLAASNIVSVATYGDLVAVSYDPSKYWAVGTYYGYHLLHSFNNSGTDGYFQLTKFSIGDKVLNEGGLFYMEENKLSGSGVDVMNYQVENPMQELGAIFLDAGYSRSSYDYESFVADLGDGSYGGSGLTIERKDIGGVGLGVIQGSGVGMKSTGGSAFGGGVGGATGGMPYKSFLWAVKSVWDDGEAARHLPRFPKADRIAECTVPLNSAGLDVGYSDVVARLEFGDDGAVAVWFYDSETGNLVYPGNLLYDGKTIQPQNPCYTWLIPYGFDKERGVCRAALPVVGAIRGKDSLSNKRAVVFSVLLDLSVTIGDGGDAKASKVAIGLADVGHANPAILPVTVP